MEIIIVLGGGSAGCMTAYTLKKLFPEKKIIMLQSKSIATIGVGESTLGQINQWLSLVGIEDKDFMKECNASYKLSIRFQDFYKKGDGGFHFPFGRPDKSNTIADFNDWHFKKIMHPETPVSDFADSYYPTMALVNQNKMFDSGKEKINLGRYNFKQDTGYHFDATLFAQCLQKKFKEIKGTIIEDDVVDVKTNEEGIDYLQTSKNGKLKADLFIDCTGFKSLLLGKTLKEPFISYEDILPNNSAWATRIQYKDKKKELVPYTNCTAIENGWVWNVPLWSRMGTGYAYSDKYISDEDALTQFKKYLKRDDLDFKQLKMKIGIHKRLFVKNVCAIGLAAGFIEPLEGNGLLSVHEFLIKLVRVLSRGSVSNFTKEQFNLSCINSFRYFAEFVAIHYALSVRTDTPYWKAIQKREYNLKSLYKTTGSMFQDLVFWKFSNFSYAPDEGASCICTGMNWGATDEFALKYGLPLNDLREMYPIWQQSVVNLEKRKRRWGDAVNDCLSLYDFLNKNIYHETNK